MRAVGSSTVYPFAKMAAERVARANPRLGTPIIESTGTGAGLKLFCAGRRRALPRHRQRLAPDEGARKPSSAPPTASRTSPKSRSASTASRSPPRARPRISGITQRDLYLAIAKTPFGKPNRAKTWKDVNAKLPALPIRVYGPPSTSGTRDALGELLMTPPCEANACDGRAQEERRGQVQGDLHRRSAPTAPTSRPARTTISSSRSSPPTRARSASSATASSRRMRRR